MCWEPQHRPDSPWLLSNWAIVGSALSLYAFSFPSSVASAIPLRDYSTSSSWKSPCLLKDILHWYSAAISDRRDSAQTEYNKHLNLSGTRKGCLTALGRKYFDRENVYALRTQDVWAWIRNNISGFELSNFTGSCLPFLTKWTWDWQHVFFLNNYPVLLMKSNIVWWQSTMHRNAAVKETVKQPETSYIQCEIYFQISDKFII